MNKRTFTRLVAMFIFLFLIFMPFQAFGKGAKQMFYEVRIYRISGSSQERVIDSWLKDAYMPALHRAGLKDIGVFKPVQSDTAYGKFVYLFIPFEKVDQYLGLEDKLNADKQYLQMAAPFIDAPVATPPFKRYESILLKAFAFMPEYRVPSYNTPAAERIYELRSYESATDAKAALKIKMFNEGGEIALFEKIGANAVFYGQVLFGSLKPRLMYMTTYADMKSHDEHWKAFRESEEWKRLSTLDEYRNTVTKANPYLLHPAEYSDF